MAFESSTDLFIGEDRKYKYAVLSADRKQAINVAGWTFSWMVKRLATDADSAKLIQKTSVAGIAIEGLYNAVPSVNTQRVVVTVDDTDSDTLVAGRCVVELKRADPGNEVVLHYGPFALRRSVHHA